MQLDQLTLIDGAHCSGEVTILNSEPSLLILVHSVSSLCETFHYSQPRTTMKVSFLHIFRHVTSLSFHLLALPITIQRSISLLFRI